MRKLLIGSLMLSMLLSPHFAYADKTLTEGEGIDLSTANGDATVAGEDASDTNKGIAKFNAANFAVSSGDVTIKSGGVDLTDEIVGTLPVGNGGVGAATLTDGGILLGSGSSAVTPMSVLADGSIVVGDGTTDPVALAAFTSSTGELKHESGGLEADVNAYSGLVAIAAGSTAEVDDKAELEAQIADVADFCEADGDTITGAWDGGGTTDFEIENAANPTVDTAGEISVDTSAGDGGMFRVYTDAEYALPVTDSKSFVLTDPDADSDYPMWKVPYAITIKEIHILCEGGTNWIGGLDEADGNGNNASAIDADITGTAGSNVNDDGTLSNPSVDADDYLLVHTTSVSGTPDSVTVTFEYTVNAVN